MQSKQATPGNGDGTKTEESSGIAHYNSDTDDWTFVSSASSGGSRASSNSSSPERSVPSHHLSHSQNKDKAMTTLGASKQQNGSQALQAIIEHQSDSTSSDQQPVSQQLVTRNTKKHMGHHKRKIGSCERADDADDESDGMTEINLSEQDDEQQQQHTSAVSAPCPMAVVSALDGAEYDVLDENELQSIDERNEEIARHHKRHPKSNNLSIENTALTERRSTSRATETTSAQEVNESTQTSERSINHEHPMSERIKLLLSGIILLITVCVTCSIVNHGVKRISRHMMDATDSTGIPVDGKTFDSIYSDPTNHAHTELKLMDEEMIECIRRENPNRKEIEQWLSMSSKELTKYEELQTNIRPYKGLVCYENEVEWRKRFNRLKSEFSLDLRKITHQIKRKITNGVLERKHPAMRFGLILNQLEYLDHIDQRRKDRALEKLKAENLELMRKLNSSKKTSSSSGSKSNKSHHINEHLAEQRHDRYQKSKQSMSANSLISLESENVRLKHEIEVLKARLTEKAGTVYIKQSIELEKCERENSALKQFHHQVAQEVTKNLKQLDQAHSMDSLAVFEHEHDESLTSRLASTRASILQLGEGITKLIATNNILERNILETQSLNERILTETNDLIEETNQTQAQSQNDQDEQKRRSEPDDSNPCMKYTELNYVRDSMGCAQQQLQITQLKGDWVIKRAKLREKLRKATGSTEQQGDLSIGYDAVPELKIGPLGQYWSGEEHKKNQGSEGRQKHHPNVRRRYYKTSQLGVNSYSQNSHKNCKDHFRREEL